MIDQLATAIDKAIAFNVEVDMRGYTSTRVFDGVRQLDNDKSMQHRDRLKKALDAIEGDAA